MRRKSAFFITGASTGIGKACALDLDRRGFRVYAGIRKQTDQEALKAQASPNLIPVFLDVTNPDMIYRTVELVEETLEDYAFGGLVNNAGIFIGGPLEFLPIVELRKQLEVNVIAPLAMIQQLMPLLRRDRGRIINISSMAGKVAFPFGGPYCASKFSLEALSDALRVELKPWGIPVSLIEPGVITTPIWQKSLTWANDLMQQMSPDVTKLYGPRIEKMFQRARKNHQSGTSPEHVAKVIAHILTTKRPKARYTVGWDARLGMNLQYVPPWLRDPLMLLRT